MKGKHDMANTSTPSSARPFPNDTLRQMAWRYCRQFGLGPLIEEHYVAPERAWHERVASAYARLPIFDPSPLVADCYTALASEVRRQFTWLSARIYIEPWTRAGQPYEGSVDLCADVAQGHLYVFMGGEPHALLSRYPFEDFDDNTRFRAVHDLFGHAAEGYPFGPRGELNAWIHHSQMFSPDAQRALTTETNGQSSWFNFGPHSDLPMRERPFATQKVGLLPEWACDWRERLGVRRTRA